MDDGKVSDDPDENKKHENNDINIFLFSNGQVYSPPRKYHLKAEELKIWDSMKNYLARSHFGYMHSTIDLYTINGKKIEDPKELADNNAYVAVESGEEFLPGGYDQYLMKASKSWIKRYGDMITEDPSKEHVQVSEKALTNSPLDNVQEIDENASKLTTAEKVGSSENKKSGDTPNNTKMPHTNTPSAKQVEKRKTSTRTSILRKNSLHPPTNDPPKKTSLPLSPKKKPGSPPKKISISKTPSLSTDNPQTFKDKKDSQQLKTILGPAKTSHISSQFAFDTIVTKTTKTSNVSPAFIIPAKLSIKSGMQTPQNESIINGNIPLEMLVQDNLIKADDNVKHEVTKLSEYDSGQKVFETLEAIIENVNSNSNAHVHATMNSTDSKVIEPFSTSMNVGDVINLRLSIELNNNTTDTHITKKANVTVPVFNNNNEYWNVPTEKSSQVNMDEMGARNETMKNILNDLNKNGSTQKYVVFYCDCCHNNIYETAKRPNNQVRKINNKDYIIILPATNHDEDLLGCKCDDELPKFDKNVQTSMIIENVECLNVASTTNIIDQSTHENKTNVDVKNVLLHQSGATNNEPDRSGKSAFLDNITVTPINEGCSNLSNENDACKSKLPTTKRISSQCQECTFMLKGNDTCSKDNKNIHTQIHDCANILGEPIMLDEATQTDYHSLLLEARRQPDGHFSFHLPPLYLVKSYQKK